MKTKSPRGFVAVLLIVTLGMLLTLTTLGAVGIARNRTALDIDTFASERALATAQSCAEEGLIRLSFNPNYSGNETLTIAAVPCSLGAVTTLANGNRRLPLSSTVDGRTRRVWIEFALNPLRVISFREDL